MKITVGEDPKYRIKIEHENDGFYLIVTNNHFGRERIRIKDITSLSPYMTEIFTHDGYGDGTLIEIGFNKYIHVIHPRADLVDAINVAMDEEELRQEMRELKRENEKLRKEIEMFKKEKS